MKQEQCDEAATKFDTLRFRFFVTVAMRAILVRDRIAMWGRGSKPDGQHPDTPTPCVVMSGSRRLEARLALPTVPVRASVLLLHGIGERLEYWSDAQQLLAKHEIASLLIAYSGYGMSEGAVTPANLRQDVIAGYAELRRLVSGVPPFVLGLSMGTGVAIDAAPHLEPTPSGIILCEAFSSLRGAAVEVCRSLPVMKYLSRWLATWMPDIYRTASTAGAVDASLLIVHSDADELFPVEMAWQIFEAARQNPEGDAELVIVRGYTHNEAYLRPTPGYWQPILHFIGRRLRVPTLGQKDRSGAKIRPMEPTEIQEFSKQMKEAGEAASTRIALAISILAVLVAMVTVLSHRSHTEAVLLQSRPMIPGGVSVAQAAHREPAGDR